MNVKPGKEGKRKQRGNGKVTWRLEGHVARLQEEPSKPEAEKDERGRQLLLFLAKRSGPERWVFSPLNKSYGQK